MLLARRQAGTKYERTTQITHYQTVDPNPAATAHHQEAVISQGEERITVPCKDCDRPLSEYEEYHVIRSVTKEPRCGHCYGLHMTKELAWVKAKLEARNYKS